MGGHAGRSSTEEDAGVRGQSPSRSIPKRLAPLRRPCPARHTLTPDLSGLSVLLRRVSAGSREPRLYVVANGQGSPCLDLRRVPSALADATVGALHSYTQCLNFFHLHSKEMCLCLSGNQKAWQAQARTWWCWRAWAVRSTPTSGRRSSAQRSSWP